MGASGRLESLNLCKSLSFAWHFPLRWPTLFFPPPTQMCNSNISATRCWRVPHNYYFLNLLFHLALIKPFIRWMHGAVMASIFQTKWTGKWLIPHADLSSPLPAGKATQSNFANIFISSTAHLGLNLNGLFISPSIEQRGERRNVSQQLRKVAVMSDVARAH